MSSSHPARTYGKGKARASSLPAREPSRSPSPAEVAPRVHGTRRATLGHPMRTTLEYPTFLSSLDLLGNYLDPAISVTSSPGLADRLMRAVVQIAPMVVRAASFCGVLYFFANRAFSFYSAHSPRGLSCLL